MSISAVGNSYVPVYPSLSPSKVSAPPGNLPLSTGVDRVKYATEMAQSYAGTAELETSRINQAIESYNHFSDDNIKKYIEEVRGDKRLLEQHLLSDGEGWEKAVEERGLMTREFAKRTIETGDIGLKAYFNVSGSTHTYDPKTDTYARGAFTASVNLGDSAVRFDSRKGPEVSIMGGSFTENFSRNFIPQMGTLDYEVINPDELEAIRRNEAVMLDIERMRIKRLDLKV